jgi:hypothetical protein
MPDLNVAWAVATVDSTSATDAAWQLFGIRLELAILRDLRLLCEYLSCRWVFDGYSVLD